MFTNETTTLRLSRNDPKSWILALLPALLFFSCSQTLPLYAKGKLPSADVVLEQYVEATGGRDAYDRITNRVTKGSIEMVSQGIEMALTVYAAKPNMVYTVLESDSIGKIESGVDGVVAWRNSTMQGPQVMEGQEKLDALRDSTFDRLAYWRKAFKKAETISVEAIEGRPAVKIRLTPAEGRDQSFYFDQESHLLVKVESTVENQMGTIPLEAYLSDYREVDGLRIPHQLRVTAMGQDRLITTKSVEHNVEMNDDRFNPPTDIRALLEKKDSQ